MAAVSQREPVSRLFNHVFRVALEALVPHARVAGSTLTVGLSKELTDMVGIEPVYKQADISPVSAHGKLTSLSITAVSGRDLKAAATRHNRRPRNVDRVRDDDIALRIQAAFSRVNASVLGFEVARLDGEFGEIFLAFNRSLTELTPAAFVKVDFSTLADWAIDIASLFTEIDHDVVNSALEDSLYPVERLIRTHLRDVLSRAIGQRAVLHDIWATTGGWQARYFIDPLLPRADLPWRPPTGPLGGFGGGALGGFTEPALAAEIGDDVGAAPPDTPPPPPPPPSDPPGVFPPGFVVEDGNALARLDRHQSIVVIMMENRSYDHLLGGLATARPRATNGYDGPPSQASNLPAGGFLEPVRFVKAREIGLGTAIPVSPNHHHLPVMFQIGDGTAETSGTGGMAGFARDLHKRTDSPQIAMTMYGEADLPVYYKLADEFCVCDRWFCAHPGPTWPNRFATMMGSIPELENFEIDDPQIGFLPHETIFDALSRNGIDWKVFESDLSQIRMFDRFRLDDAHVVPIDDRKDGLDATMRSSSPLPRVMFVEPNFADLPPLATANDDHPPADLAAGQAFIARVLDAIISAGRFDDCLVLITYDEHGGFYDHVPPPGTPKAEPTPVGLRSRLHPDGPECLGVRVPTFVISPFVSAGAISRTIFDHTSILKSILVHNRARLAGSVLGSFGPRVNAAAHLGQALDLDAPRPPPLPFDLRRRQPAGTGPGGAAADLDGSVLATDVTLSAGGAPAAPPIPPRTVTIVPRAAQPEQEQDPRDFHTALRRALQPRR
jgi:phospholipase C